MYKRDASEIQPFSIIWDENYLFFFLFFFTHVNNNDDNNNKVK